MINKYPVKGIFFDLDGTLLDTSEDFVVVVHQMQSEAHIPLLDPDLIRKHVSEGSRKLVQLAYNLPDSAPELPAMREQFLAKYDQHIQQQDRNTAAKLYDGMQTLLLAIEHRGIPWGIVTNKPEAYTLPLLRQCQLDRRYQALVCPEHIKNTKPDPEPLFLACQKTRTKPENCIYIGDHLRDIEAGRSAGMHTITALYGYIPDSEDPENWPADHTIQHASEILPWLEQEQWQITRRTDNV